MTDGSPDRAALLRRFQPQLRYDSQEAFFADSAAEWTDNPGNVLRRADGTVLAAATPVDGQPRLALDFLGGRTYANGASVEKGDHIACPGRDYRAQYVALRMRPGYRNRMYGRAKEDSDGRLWLQYWLWYFYNDYNLAARIGLHEGDWEMVQLRMHGERPDLAVYAQHSHAERALWEDVEKLPDSPDTAVVYVARGSHASYFTLGFHQTEAWYDIADGRRKTPKLELEIVDDGAPPWVDWPGRWGDTPARLSPIDSPSPTGPSQKPQWDDPQRLLAEARSHTTGKARAAPPVRVSRDGGRLRLDYDLRGERPDALVVTVNSRDDRLPPRTHTFGVGSALRGTIVTRIELEPKHHYDVYVSTTDARGVPSEARLSELDPAGERKPGRSAVVGAVARAVDWIRRRGRRR